LKQASLPCKHLEVLSFSHFASLELETYTPTTPGGVTFLTFCYCTLELETYTICLQTPRDAVFLTFCYSRIALQQSRVYKVSQFLEEARQILPWNLICFGDLLCFALEFVIWLRNPEP